MILKKAHCDCLITPVNFMPGLLPQGEKTPDEQFLLLWEKKKEPNTHKKKNKPKNNQNNETRKKRFSYHAFKTSEYFPDPARSNPFKLAKTVLCSVVYLCSNVIKLTWSEFIIISGRMSRRRSVYLVWSCFVKRKINFSSGTFLYSKGRQH